MEAEAISLWLWGFPLLLWPDPQGSSMILPIYPHSIWGSPLSASMPPMELVGPLEP